MQNPWMPQGVSIFDPGSMLPIIGQKELFQKLLRFKQDMLKSSHLLTGFFALVGGWGVGKSRVGHEVCLEAIDSDAEWVVEHRGQRLLMPGLKEGVLPLFIRYSQVTETKHLADHLSTETWIPICACRALSFLVSPPSLSTGSTNRRNQARIIEGILPLLNAKGFEAYKGELEKALKETDFHAGLTKAMAVLKNVGVEHLWIIIDEIEDITDVEREGLPDDDRKGVDKAFLTVIPRVIKHEEVRMDFPHVNFLLLTARSVGDFLRDIRALERRTDFIELQTNAFHDVEDYFLYIQSNYPKLRDAMKDYRPGLKEAAFFAANRNFGWFNVIMAYCHENHRGGTVSVPDLLRSFAEYDSKAERSVFDIKATSDTMIRADADKPRTLELLFGQLPQRIGDNPNEISSEEAERLFRKPYGGTESPLFAPVIEVDAPRDEIPKYLREAGFLWEEGSTFSLPGEGRFDLDLILASLASYSIGLPPEDRGHLLIFEDTAEFTEQLRGLTPYDNEAMLVSEPLHRFLTHEAYRVKEEERERRYLAPSFSFLLRFNRLNKRVQADVGYLRDPKKNTELEERYNAIKNDPPKRINALLRGIANAWEEDHVAEGTTAKDLQSPSFVFTATRDPLSLGTGGQVTLVYAPGGKEAEEKLEADLKKLAPKPERPAHPVLLVLESAADREDALIERVQRVAPTLTPFAVARSFSPYQVEILIRQGLMGEAFSPADLRTGQFASGISLSRQHLSRALQGEPKAWRERLEENGLILRPVFFRKTVQLEDYRILATGHSLMLTAKKSYDQLLANATFTEDEKDRFRNRVKDHVLPPAKYEGQKALGIFSEQSGTFVPKVPQALVSVLQAFGSIARPPAQLEPVFLYAYSDPSPQDVMRQICSFLEALGFLEAEGAGKFRRVSGKLLKDSLVQCQEWLEGTTGQDFRACLASIKAIHEDVANNQLEMRAKEARERIKKAQTVTDTLSLKFLDRNWMELHEEIPDIKTGKELPRYVVEYRDAVDTVVEARQAIKLVYDARAYKDLAGSYSPDLLQEYEANHARDNYPLWKRVAILSGFYSNLSKLRAQLLDRIKEQMRQGHDLIEESPDGQKIFPTQVLTNVLKVWRQELSFPSSKPHETIRIGGGTLGAASLGFKVAAGKYREAWNRVSEIEAELTQPGKIPARYFKELERWRELQADQSRLAKDVASWSKFFSDAAAEVRSRFGIDALAKEIAALETILRGGIREGSDDREAAGHSIFKLIDGLEADLKEIEKMPPTIRARLNGLEQGILEALTLEFEAAYRDILGAYARVCVAKKLSLKSWPATLAATYGLTRQLFDELVSDADAGGRTFFQDVSELKWEDYVSLCKMDAEKKDIPWEEEPYSSYVSPLQRKSLVKLRLV